MSGRLGNKAFSNIKLHKNEDNLIMIPLNEGFEPLIHKVDEKYVFNTKFVDGNTFNGTSPKIIISTYEDRTFRAGETITVTCTIILEAGQSLVSPVTLNIGTLELSDTEMTLTSGTLSGSGPFVFSKEITFADDQNEENQQIQITLQYTDSTDATASHIITGKGQSITVDTTAPAFTLTNGNNGIIQHEFNTSLVLNKPEYIDLSSGSEISISDFVPSLDTNTLGNYIKTYTATDLAGNVTSKTLTVVVTDGRQSYILLNGYNPDYLLSGQDYLQYDEGATVFDYNGDQINKTEDVQGVVQITGETEQINVLVVENTGTTSSYVYQIDGENKKDINLIVGMTYKFNIAEGSNHPFELSESALWMSNSTGKYNGNDVTYTNTLVTLTVTESTPKTLYYYCFNHSGMGGSITQSILYKYTDENDYYSDESERAEPVFRTLNLFVKSPPTITTNPADTVASGEIITIYFNKPHTVELNAAVVESYILEIKDTSTPPNMIISRNIEQNQTSFEIDTSQLPYVNGVYMIEMYTLYKSEYLGDEEDNISIKVVKLLNIKVTVTVSTGAVSLEVGPQRVMNSVSNERTVNVYANLNKEYNNVSGLEGSETWSTGTILNSIDFNLTCAASNIVNITKVFNGIDAIAFGAVTDETDVSFVKCSGLNVGTGSLDHVKICTVTVKDVTSLGVNNIIFANGNELWDTKEDPNVSITDFEISGQVDLN